MVESASEAVLFHLTKTPVENTEFIAVEGDADAEEDNGQPWGQTKVLEQRILDDKLLEVAIDGDTPGMVTLIPERSKYLYRTGANRTSWGKKQVRVDFKLFHLYDD